MSELQLLILYVLDLLNTFNKELSGALLLSHHTAICCIICQGAVVDGEVAHVADTLKDVPVQRAGRILHIVNTCFRSITF